MMKEAFEKAMAEKQAQVALEKAAANIAAISAARDAQAEAAQAEYVASPEGKAAAHAAKRREERAAHAAAKAAKAAVKAAEAEASREADAIEAIVLEDDTAAVKAAIAASAKNVDVAFPVTTEEVEMTGIDINNATTEELTTLPGVGPVLAKRIVAQRAQEAFETIEDLKKVAGIGDRVFAKIETLVKVTATVSWFVEAEQLVATIDDLAASVEGLFGDANVITALREANLIELLIRDLIDRIKRRTTYQALAVLDVRQIDEQVVFPEGEKAGISRSKFSFDMKKRTTHTFASHWCEAEKIAGVPYMHIEEKAKAPEAIWHAASEVMLDFDYRLLKNAKFISQRFYEELAVRMPKGVDYTAYAQRFDNYVVPGGYCHRLEAAIVDLQDLLPNGETIRSGADGHGVYDSNINLLPEAIVNAITGWAAANGYDPANPPLPPIQFTGMDSEGLWITKGILRPCERVQELYHAPVAFDCLQIKGAVKAEKKGMVGNGGIEKTTLSFGVNTVLGNDRGIALNFEHTQHLDRRAPGLMVEFDSTVNNLEVGDVINFQVDGKSFEKKIIAIHPVMGYAVVDGSFGRRPVRGVETSTAGITAVYRKRVVDLLISCCIADAIAEREGESIYSMLKHAAEKDENLARLINLYRMAERKRIQMPEIESIDLVRNAIRNVREKFAYRLVSGFGIRGSKRVVIMDNTLAQGTCVIHGFDAGQSVVIYRTPNLNGAGLTHLETVAPELNQAHAFNCIYMHPDDAAKMQADDDGDVVGCSADPKVVALLSYVADKKFYQVEPQGTAKLDYDTGKELMTESDNGRKYASVDPRGPVGPMTVLQMKILSLCIHDGGRAMISLIQEAIDIAKRNTLYTKPIASLFNKQWEWNGSAHTLVRGDDSTFDEEISEEDLIRKVRSSLLRLAAARMYLPEYSSWGPINADFKNMVKEIWNQTSRWYSSSGRLDLSDSSWANPLVPCPTFTDDNRVSWAPQQSEITNPQLIAASLAHKSFAELGWLETGEEMKAICWKDFIFHAVKAADVDFMGWNNALVVAPTSTFVPGKTPARVAKIAKLIEARNSKVSRKLAADGENAYIDEIEKEFETELLKLEITLADACEIVRFAHEYNQKRAKNGLNGRITLSAQVFLRIFFMANEGVMKRAIGAEECEYLYCEHGEGTEVSRRIDVFREWIGNQADKLTAAQKFLLAPREEHNVLTCHHCRKLIEDATVEAIRGDHTIGEVDAKKWVGALNRMSRNAFDEIVAAQDAELANNEMLISQINDDWKGIASLLWPGEEVVRPRLVSKRRLTKAKADWEEKKARISSIDENFNMLITALKEEEGEAVNAQLLQESLESGAWSHVD